MSACTACTACLRGNYCGFCLLSSKCFSSSPAPLATSVFGLVKDDPCRRHKLTNHFIIVIHVYCIRWNINLHHYGNEVQDKQPWPDGDLRTNPRGSQLPGSMPPNPPQYCSASCSIFTVLVGDEVWHSGYFVQFVRCHFDLPSIAHGLLYYITPP